MPADLIISILCLWLLANLLIVAALVVLRDLYGAWRVDQHLRERKETNR